ncbi:MAG: DEAD/DEAH box helicase [Bacteroidaceae bacterium]|nr:DEAD/DEAH box helicase [Bacteroidaceae bacterium]
MQFEELDLNYDILDALDDMHFVECTPIQEQAIPPLLEGRDLIGVAQTGTGKTAAYLLPVLSLLRDGGFPQDAINCVIMAPTRELAQQIDQAMEGFSYYLDDISSVSVYGGNDGIRYEQEKRALALGADVVIATPGRLISHLSLGNVDLSRVSFFILDEADRMLDMGFYDDIMQIVKQLPADRQTIMFSATMPDKIVELAKTILHNPVEVKIALNKPAEGIHQSAFVCYEPQKMKIIEFLLGNPSPSPVREGSASPHHVIIFVGKKTHTKDVAITLKRKGYNAEAMHSDLLQQQRDDVMYRFKTRQIDILVATDIVARGIDIDDIQLVINYDVPRDEEDYVHRIGRTARAGKDGRAVTLISDKDQPYFAAIERFLESEVTKEPVPAEFGETPAYTGRGSGSRSASGRGRKRKRGGHGHHDKKKQSERQERTLEKKEDMTNEKNGNRPKKKKRKRPNNKDGNKANEKNGEQ